MELRHFILSVMCLTASALHAAPPAYDLSAFLAFDESQLYKPRRLIGDPAEPPGGDGRPYAIGTSYREQFNLGHEMTPYTHELFGEQIGLQSGSLTFRQTDVQIPGNFAIPVEVTRNFIGLDGIEQNSREFGVWGLDLPQIRSNLISEEALTTPMFKGLWAAGTACSGALSDRGEYGNAVDNAQLQREKGQSFWNGDNIAIPGEGVEKILQKTVNGVQQKSTANNWKISCSTVNGREAIVVNLPDGRKYTFSQLRLVRGRPLDLKLALNYGAAKQTEPYRLYHAFLLPSRVEDRFGNSVIYSYGVGSRLESITASDGRKITLTYNSLNMVDAVYAHSSSTSAESGRKWSYSYSQLGTDPERNPVWGLVQVMRPDGKSWRFAEQNISAMFGAQARIFDPAFSPCDMAGLSHGTLIRMTHPEGTTAVFSFAENLFKRTAVPPLRVGPDPWIKPPSNPNVLESMRWYAHSICPTQKSITEKKLILTSGQEYSWAYQYHGMIGYHQGSSNQGDQDVYFQRLGLTNMPYGLTNNDIKSVEVTQPDGSKIAHHFSARWGWTENKELFTDYLDTDGTTLLRRDRKQYAQSAEKGYSFVRDDLFSGYADRLVSEQQEFRYGNGTDLFSTSYSDFNLYDLPQLTVQTFNGQSKYQRQEYQHDVTRWWLNFPTKSFVSDNGTFVTPYQESVYNSLMQPVQQKLFTNLIKTNSYHADGNLAQVSYNGTNRYERYDNYQRGQASKITLPCGLSNLCNGINGASANTLVAIKDIDMDGNVLSISDFSGNKTSYSYNSLGLMTKIDYLDPKWQDKTIDYSVVSAYEDGVYGSGVTVGSLKQTISAGNYESVRYLDSLWRPYFQLERDKSISTTARYQRTSYDFANRVTFAGLPQTTAAERSGWQSQFNVLGWLVSKTRNTDNSSMRYSYLSGNRITVQDAQGFSTNTSYRAFGTAEHRLPLVIDAPATERISMDYNSYDQLTMVRQGNVAESRFYDNAQQLCAQQRPETGLTAFGYNAQRQLAWQANGQGGAATSCPQIATSQQMQFSYDNLAQLRTVKFPDSTPQRTYSYDQNGNLQGLQAGESNWSYLYNSLNLIEKETLVLNGKTFIFDWEYNALAKVQSLLYPTGLSVDFAPNALGQPSKAGPFASNASYHANGQLKQFGYGNGLMFTQGLDSSLRTSQLQVQKGVMLVNQLSHSYNSLDQLTALTDTLDNRNNLGNFSYDGAGRLLNVSGPFGNANYSYDGLGNLRQKTDSNQTINLGYDSLNRLNQLSGAVTASYSYDPRGNVIHNGRYGLSVNAAQQMVSANGIAYLYDGFNRRVRKTRSGAHSYSVYSQAGQLLHRVGENGKGVDVIYLNGQLVAEQEQ